MGGWMTKGPLAVLLALGVSGCKDEPAAGERDQSEEDWAVLRARMVDDQLATRDIRDRAVLDAMRMVPRHRFVPAEARRMAYNDHPAPIGFGQTISQPYIVAIMTQLAEVGPGDRVLEIGTGSGYQAAVLAEVGAEVWTIEIVEALGRRAEATLRELGYDQVHVRVGDGYRGWPEQAPFDAVILTAAPPRIPAPLKEQVAVGGRLVAPVGDEMQELIVLTRTPTGFSERRVFGVMFVPMTGEAQRR